jgi:ATP-dependent Clp protease adaptor protein ClpS
MGRVTDSQQQTDTITQTQLAPPWNVIVHNDPITLMSYVTMAIQRIFGYDYGKAHGMMMEVHNAGRSIVWTGAREPAEVYLHKLHAQQLLATMECTQE